MQRAKAKEKKCSIEQIKVMNYLHDVNKNHKKLFLRITNFLWQCSF